MERRQFLAAGATLAVASQAGCTGLFGGSSGLSAGDVGDWLLNPNTLDSDRSHYSFEATSPSGLSDQTDDPYVAGRFAPDTTAGGFTASDIDLELSYSASGLETTVYTGTIDSEWIGQRIESDGSLSTDRGYEGVDIYSSDNDTFAVGIDDSTMIEVGHASTSPEASEFVRTLIDTESGNARGYADVSRDMESLIDELPGGHEISGQTFDPREQTNAPQGVFENQVASGRSRTVDGEETKETTVLVFVNESDILDREIEEYIDTADQFQTYLGRPDYDTNGTTVTIEGAVPT